MKTILKISSLLLIITLFSCSEEDLNKVLNNSALTDEEIAQGLKSALVVGTDTSTAILSAEGGYYNDQAVRILLPSTLQQSIKNFRSKSITLGFTTVTGEQIYSGTSILGVSIPGLKSKEYDLILGINKAAENAASSAAPIFVDAIDGISITDASNILFGGIDTAATAYLKSQTYSALYDEYEPKIDLALKSVTIGNVTVADSYEAFVADYNAVLNTNLPGFGTIGALMGIQTIGATDLSSHSTEKGLNGLFNKVAEEEIDIRENPLARVNSLLERVFGALD